MKISCVYIFITTLLLTTSRNTALAYIDPGTGSYLTQILIASLLAIPFIFSDFVSKVKVRIKGVYNRLAKKKHA